MTEARLTNVVIAPAMKKSGNKTQENVFASIPVSQVKGFKEAVLKACRSTGKENRTRNVPPSRRSDFYSSRHFMGIPFKRVPRLWSERIPALFRTLRCFETVEISDPTIWANSQTRRPC